MRPTQEAIERLTTALRLETPLLALYDSAPLPEHGPVVTARGRTCCFAYYNRWLRGHTLAIERADDPFDTPRHGCPGAQRALGLAERYPDWMPNFLTDGKNGAPMGEGLKASPDLAREFIGRARPPRPGHGYVLLGPLRPSLWDDVRTVTFLVDPDRLAAVMTLASYWSSSPDEVKAPFSSGCGLLWRELLGFEGDHALVGCTDIAMRRYLPREILCLTVTAARFERMLELPGDSFLFKEWWKELMDHRARGKPASEE